MAEAGWLPYGTAFLVLLNSFIPRGFQPDFDRWFSTLFSFLSPFIYYTIPEYDGHMNNELFSSVQVYLSDLAATRASDLNLSTAKNASSLTFALSASSHAIPDTSFLSPSAFSASWWFKMEPRHSTTISWDDAPQDERRSLHLRVYKKHRKSVSAYLAHVVEKAKELTKARKERQLFTNLKARDGYSFMRGKLWEAVPFKHPATFETLALDPSLKADIIEDLQEFARGRDFYRRAGRAWKRGYLLYGPPGTGKSSMIAAIANLLQYDVYDLELTEVKTNLALKTLLLKTGDRSVIVIEDIDCTLDLTTDRATKQASNKPRKPAARVTDNSEAADATNQLTLSGLLNFIDGLWSSCGDERIFIFTTNHIEKLDPALIRSGRMDRHIHLSYCCFHAVKILIKNYLQVDEHPLFDDIRRAVVDEGGQMTPAEVSEVLTKEKRNVEEALRRLVEEIGASKAKREVERKQKEKEEAEKAKEKEEEEKANNNNNEKRSSCECCHCCCRSSRDGDWSSTDGLKTTPATEKEEAEKAKEKEEEEKANNNNNEKRSSCECCHCCCRSSRDGDWSSTDGLKTTAVIP